MKSTRVTPARYRAARVALGMTQSEFAALFGIRANTVWRKERGWIPITMQDEHLLNYLLADRGLKLPPTPRRKAAR